jgi:hypothetical protein
MPLSSVQKKDIRLCWPSVGPATVAMSPTISLEKTQLWLPFPALESKGPSLQASNDSACNSSHIIFQASSEGGMGLGP